MENFQGKTWLIKIPEVVYNEILNQSEIGMLDIITPKYPEPKNPKKSKMRVRLTREFQAQNFNINYDPTDYYITFKDKKKEKSMIKRIDFFGRFIASDDTVSDIITNQVTLAQLNHTPTILMHQSKGRKIIEENQNSHQKQKQKTQVQEKKTRMPRDELKAEIFNLFNERKYLSAKEIRSKLEQPDNYLKEVLNDVCDYNKAGPNKGCYELKRTFIRETDRDDKLEESDNDIDNDDLDYD